MEEELTTIEARYKERIEGLAVKHKQAVSKVNEIIAQYGAADGSTSFILF